MSFSNIGVNYNASAISKLNGRTSRHSFLWEDSLGLSLAVAYWGNMYVGVGSSLTGSPSLSA